MMLFIMLNKGVRRRNLMMNFVYQSVHIIVLVFLFDLNWEWPEPGAYASEAALQSVTVTMSNFEYS